MNDRLKIALERLVRSTTHPKAPKEYFEDVLVIRNAITELESDTARLDWIEKNDPLIRKVGIINEWLVGSNRESFADLRHAIDEAMKENEQ
jgi:hypothetical protein